MAYDVRTQDNLAKWWITGTGSTVNRLSEVMDDMPDGPAIYHADADNAWTAGTGSEWYVATATKPDDVADNLSGWSKLTGTADNNMGSLNTNEWTYDTTNSRVYVRLSDSSDPNATDIRKHYAWDGSGAGPNVMTEHIEDKIYEIHLQLIIGDGSTATTLESEKENVFLNMDDGSNFDFVTASSTLQLGLKDASGFGYNGSNWTFQSGASPAYTRVYCRDATMKIYGSLLECNLDASSNKWMDLYGTGTTINWEILDSNFNDFSFRPHNGNATNLCDIQRSVFRANNGNGIYLGTSWTTEWNYVYCITNIATNAAGTFNVFNSNIIGDIIIFGENCFFNFINPAFTPKLPLIQNSRVNSYVSYKYTFDITIQDENDNPIENASVACEDQFGDAEFTTQLTDSNGQISQQQIEYCRWTGDPEVLTSYYPHKFIISKENYETITIEDFTISEALNWRFVMKALRHPTSPWLIER